MNQIKTTAFTQKHIELGAKMVPFAGFNMPVEYVGINEEHNHVRTKVGVFDVSHMAEFWVKGPNALDFLQFVTSNDVSALTQGKIQYTCIPNGKGGIVDDMLVYCIDDKTYLLVPNASNREKDFAHLAKYAPKFGITVGKELYDASDEISQLAVQGPDALKLMNKICDQNLEEMQYYTFRKISCAGIKDVIVSITGYTGEKGCEIYIANKDADQLWSALFDAGKEFDLKPIGLGARDTLRLEMGFCLYGNDIDETTSPIEAGLGWITKFNDSKGDFLDREYLEKQKREGVTRKLTAFELIDRGISRHGYPVCDADGNDIGFVTSGTMAPTVKRAIGMAYIKPEFAKIDSEIFIKVREKLLRAKVVKLPFYKK